jgi:WD40 repeat protein
LSPNPADELTFSADGRRLLAVKFPDKDLPGKASLFEVDTGREVQTWKVDKRSWQAFALNPDGMWVVSGGADKLIRLWDSATGRELAQWEGHKGGISALLFSKDGNTLYSGGQDGTLKLWNLPFIRKEFASLGLDWK